MANDDAKIQLGIDVEALQRSAREATNILAKTFEQQNLGANVLGSGIPATQLPQQGEGKDSLRGVIDALERIERTLTIGFTSLTGGVYTGGGGGGGAGTQPPPSQPNKPQGGGSYGWGDALSRAGDLSSALMPSFNNAFQGGFYGTDVVGAANSFVSQIPVVGKLLSSMITPVRQEMQSNDEFKDRQYQLFRDAGPNAMGAFTDLWTPREGDDQSGLYEQYTHKYGMSRNETQSLVGSGFKNGLNFGNQGMEAVMNAQGVLGLGTEAAGTLGALKRGGLEKGGEMDALASAIGVAVSTGLERGRWAEMFTMWQRAAQSSIDVDVSMKDVISKSNFIGSLGERYKGDSAAAQSMQQSITSMASNVSDPLAFSAAMQLTGGGPGAYAKALQRMEAEAQTPDVELENAAMNRVESSGPVQDYLNAPGDDETQLAQAALHAHLISPIISMLRWKAIIRERKRNGTTITGAPSAAAMDQGKQIMNGNTALPDKAMEHLRSETMKQRVGLGNNSVQEGRSDSYYGQSVSQPVPGSADPSAMGASSTGTSASDAIGISGSSQSSNQSYGQYVMQPFGNRIKGGKPHDGVDLAFPPGTTITCPADATIVSVNLGGKGEEVGAWIILRTADGQLWRLGHIDPKTVSAGLRPGDRISKGTVLGKTFSFSKWSDTGVRTHLHLSQQTGSGMNGPFEDPMRPGGIDPGSLTGGGMPSSSGGGAEARGGGGGASRTDHHVHVHVTTDHVGRPQVRVKQPTPSVVSSPGQMTTAS